MTDLRETISKAIILIGFVGAVWVTNVEPMTGGSWAMPTAQAVAASPSSHVSLSRPYRASILIAGGGNQ